MKVPDKIQKYFASKNLFLPGAAIVFFLSFFAVSTASATTCGDLFCEFSETPSTCPIDCQLCGDLECDSFETADTCPLDCLGFCGDLICDPGEEQTCPEECAVDGEPICGDEECSPGEASGCPVDCIGDPAICFDSASCDDGDPCTADTCEVLGCNSTPLPDTDGDETCDANDTDDDNDGVGDADDSDDANPNVCRDADADGCDDCAVGVDGFGPAADFNPANDGADNDGDGACDAGDSDDDNDGLNDGDETVTDPFDPDTDDDGICDGPLAVASVCTAGPDNCPIAANPRQSDVDADGKGDVCDSSPVEDVDGLCPCTTCPDDLLDVEISGVPAFPDSVVDKATCNTERNWTKHDEYVNCVKHVTNFLGKYTSFDKSKVQSQAAKNNCGR